MDFDKLNKLFTLGANLGVLVGIIFLALEVQQNNALMESEARYNRLEAVYIVPQLLLEKSDLNLLSMTLKPVEELTPEELAATGIIGNLMFNSVEWTFRELPRSELPIERWHRIVNQERYRNAWATLKNDYADDFVEFMDTVVFIY